MALYEWKVERCNKGQDAVVKQLQEKLNELEADGFEIFAIELGIEHPMIVARRKKGA